MVRGLWDSLTFLVIGPVIVLFLVAVNVMAGGEWWVQWPALGIGLAWFFCLLRVIRAALVVGGLAGLFALLNRR